MPTASRFFQPPLILLLAALSIGAITSAAPRHAQSKTLSSANDLSAAHLRNSDGTLTLSGGTKGSFDLQGWQVSLAPRRGPVLARPASAGASSLVPLGDGVNGTVDALAVNGSDVYVAGDFTEVCGNPTCDSGNTTVNRIAKWNGSSWSALGNGLSASVTAMAISGSDLVVGGFFSEVCGNEACDSGNTPVNYVARWSNNTWSPLGNGVSNGVYALKVKGSDVYVGGQFTETCGNAACTTGNSTVNHIAKWTGTTWSAIGSGFDDYVSAIGVKGKNLYAGGHFKEICGNGACDTGNTNAHNIARWNGSSWSALGMGVSNDPNAIEIIGSDVYIAGFFSGLCTDEACVSNLTPMNRITRWNGSSFQPVGFGVSFIVYDLYLSGGAVYAGGEFLQVCGNEACNSSNSTVNRIAKWNGASWTGFDFGVNDSAYAVAVTGDDLHVGGIFTARCGNDACDDDNVAVNHLAEFTVPPCSATAAKPALNTPLNTAVSSKARVKLGWSAVECADTYQAIIKDAITGDVVAKSEKNSNLSYKTDPLVDGTYKWVVKVCNFFGCSKSVKNTFTVQ